MATAQSFYGVDIGEHSGSTAAATAEVLEVFEFLKPKASKTPLIRIGGDIDGSYLVPDDLEGIAACFSPGVSRIKYFEDFLAERYGIPSHMCDFSCDVEELQDAAEAGDADVPEEVARRGVRARTTSASRTGSQTTTSRATCCSRWTSRARNTATSSPPSDETLARFRVIVLEVHSLGRMLDAADSCGMPSRRSFRSSPAASSCVHAHPNNCCGDFMLPDTDIRIPNVLELTLVRRDRFAASPRPGGAPPSARREPQRRGATPPLFLSEAWCDYQRPLESRVKMLEDTQRYRDDAGSLLSQTPSSGPLSP